MKPCAVWVILAAAVTLSLSGCMLVPVPIPIPYPSTLSRGAATDAPGAPAVARGPVLGDPHRLPVDPSGEGTITGAPTGEADTNQATGSFVVVLSPAPTGLPDRSTVHVSIDKSSKVYRGGDYVGDALDALNSESSSAADPTAAGTVTVRFTIRDGQPYAERIDVSQEYPAGLGPTQ